MMAVDFDSAFAVGGAAGEAVQDLALDGAGNTCVVGVFFGTTDFDPGPGTYELTPEPGGDLFAAKYDPAGNLLWAQRMDGSAPNFGPEIAAGSDGSVYVVGSFAGSADFGATTLTSLGDTDAFVTKIDADGNIVWANRFGGANADWGNDVAVDGNGNVYVIAETRTASNGNPDAFVAKMDSSGSVQWSNAIGASSAAAPAKGKPAPAGWARGFKITVDAAGDVYATGRMGGTVDFDPSSGTTALAGSAFVTKFSTGGNHVWARTFTGTTVEPHDIVVDNSGNVYSTGIYLGSVDFDPGTAKSQKFILNAAYYGSYVSALNSSGNFLWAKSTSSFDTNNYGWAEAMALDGQGGVYVAGRLVGTVDFDPGAGTFNLTSAGDADAFVWQLNASGNFVWAGRMGGTGADEARGIGVDAAGSIFVGGFFNGTADFDPGSGTYNMTSAGGNDFFVAKLVQPVALAATQSEPTNASLTAEPIPRTRKAAVDSAFAELSAGNSDNWIDALDVELLMAFATA